MATFTIDLLNPSKPIPSPHLVYLRTGFIYTHQCVGTGSLTVKGSNDGVNFVDLIALVGNDAETVMHSFRFLKVDTTGDAQYLLCRGY